VIQLWCTDLIGDKVTALRVLMRGHCDYHLEIVVLLRKPLVKINVTRKFRSLYVHLRCYAVSNGKNCVLFRGSKCPGIRLFGSEEVSITLHRNARNYLAVDTA
jgi:hypothetical protein